MGAYNNDALDSDVQLAWRRFRGKATAEQMLRWLKHNLQREYESKVFEASLERLRSRLEDNTNQLR